MGGQSGRAQSGGLIQFIARVAMRAAAPAHPVPCQLLGVRVGRLVVLLAHALQAPLGVLQLQLEQRGLLDGGGLEPGGWGGVSGG